MATDATLLTVGVDSSGVRQGTDDLGAFEKQSKSTEEQNSRMVQSWKQSTAELGKSRAEIMLMRAENAGLTESQGQIARAAILAQDAFDKQADAAKKNADQMRAMKIEAAALVVSLTLVAHQVAEAVKAYIDYADKLDEIAEKTGSTAQRIGELGFAAEQSDTNLENLTQRLGILADKAQAAAGGSKEAAQTFEQMGISVTNSAGALKSQDALLLEIADKFKGYADGTAKAALAQDLFGRGGRDLIPLLNKGAAGIEELSARYRSFSGDMDAAGKLASDFNDTMSESESRSRALVGQFAGPMEEAIGGIAQAFMKGAGAGDALKTAGQAVAQVFKIMAAGAYVLWQALHQVGDTIGALYAATFAGLSGDFKGAANIFKDLGKNWVAAAQTTVDGVVNIVDGMSPKIVAAVGKGDAPIIAKVRGTGKKVVDEWQKALDALGQMKVKTNLDTQSLFQTDAITDAEKALAEYAASPAWGKLTEAKQKVLTLEYQNLAVQQRANAQMKEDMKTAADYAAQRKKEDMKTAADYAAQRKKEEEEFQKSVSDTTDKDAELIQKIKDETAVIGMSAQGRERYNAQLLLSQERQKGLITSDEELAKRQMDLNKALDAKFAKEKQQDQLDATKKAYTDLFESIDKAASDTWNNIFDGGTNVFKKLTDTLKSTLLALLYQMTIRPFIINIVGNITGQQGVANTMLGGGAGGGGLGGISSLFGGSNGGGMGGMFSSLSAGYGAFATSGLGGSLGLSGSLIGQAGSLSLGVETAGAAAGEIGLTGAGAALGGALAAIGTVMPYIAIALAIAQALGAFDHGGPKNGGSASAGIDLASGEASSGTLERYFTPNDADAALQKTATSLVQTYTDIAHSLGANAGNAEFRLGYDADPQGKAQSRTSVGAFVDGKEVFNHRDVDVGRDDPQKLQDQIELDSKRAILAALQNSQLPEYLTKILDSVNANTATSEDIDNITKVAQTMKLAVDAFAGMSDQFNKLDPEQVKAVIDAFGGIDQFAASVQYVQANFTTNAEKIKIAQDALDKSFGDLNLTVPKTHQEFLALLASFDLTTEEGRKLYAQVSALAPAFVNLNGTAEDAAKATEAQAEANKKLIESAEDFFSKNFYSEAEQQAVKLAQEQAQIAAASAKLNVVIPTSIEGFRKLVESIDRTTPEGEALYEALIILAPAVFDVATAAGDAATNVDKATEALRNLANVDVGSEITQAYQNVADVVDMIKGLTDEMSGDTGDKLSTDVSLLNEQIAKYSAMNAAYKKTYGVNNDVYTLTISLLKNQQAAWANQLAQFTLLKAQYGDKADDLFALQQWYDQQKAALAGNVDALAVLKQIFDEKWKAIIDGVATGVEGTAEQLKKLAESIREYLLSLKESSLSPLSPLQKLTEAQKAYEEQLAKAQGGDQDAIANITKYSDAYLQLAREVFASSPLYNKIFDTVYHQLEALANLIDPLTQDGGNAAPDAYVPTPIDKAAPIDSPIASKNDILNLTGKVEELTESMVGLMTQVRDAAKEIPRAHADSTKRLAESLGRAK